MSADDAVMTLLEEFAAARARGERPDPEAYAQRAGADAPRLLDLIEQLVTTSAPPPPAPDLVAMMDALLDDEPPLLALRRRRGLTLDGITDRLMGALDIRPDARPRVRALYQRLEGGRLALAGATEALRAALAGALSVDVRDIGWTHTATDDAVFARGPEGWRDAVAALPPDDVPGPPCDAVDALFGYAPS